MAPFVGYLNSEEFQQYLERFFFNVGGYFGHEELPVVHGHHDAQPRTATVTLGIVRERVYIECI